MNNNIQTVKKQRSSIDIYIVLILLLSFSLYNFIHSCQLFTSFSFDYQIPISWQFTSLLDLQPYRDIYYPYGVLFYEKYSNIFFALLYFLLNPLLFMTIFLILRRLFIERIVAYIFFIGFFVFVNIYTTIEVFNRYGITVSYVLLLGFLFHRYVYLPKKFALLIGVVNGIVLSLVHDQEIYCLLATIVFFILNPILREGKQELMKKRYYTMSVKNIVLVVSGFIVSSLPFVGYLLYNNLLTQFGNFFLEIADFGIYAKTPFIPYSGTIDNIFIYIPLLITIFFLTTKLSLFQKELPYRYYVLWSLFMVIILLEQKSMVRSISSQITFVAFLLFVVLLSEIDSNILSMKITKVKRIVGYVSIILLVFFLGLHSNKSFTTIAIETQEAGLQKQLSSRANICLSQNITTLNRKKPIYKDVVNLIKKDKPDAKLFSYLSDPIYYVLFNQVPPYYWTIYEASPLYAQQQNIRYLQKMQVDYVIYNTDLTKLSDGVPVYARGSMLFKYIITHFTFYKQKDNFIILKKNKEQDIFTTFPSNESFFARFLLDINLAAIPKSEGLYKEQYLKDKKNKNIIASHDTKKINKYLSSHTIDSKNVFLVLTSSITYKDIKEVHIEIKTKDNLKTTITLHTCFKNKPCIINLGNVPLFYKKRILSNITTDKNFIGDMALMQVNNRDKFW